MDVKEQAAGSEQVTPEFVKPRTVTVMIDNGDPYTVDVSGEPFETDMTDEEAEAWIKEIKESGEADSLEVHIAGAIIGEIQEMGKPSFEVKKPGIRYEGPRLLLIFQEGPVREVGYNGMQPDTVIDVLIDHYKYLQSVNGCREYALVITKLEEAQMWDKRKGEMRKTGR